MRTEGEGEAMGVAQTASGAKPMCFSFDVNDRPAL